MSWLFLIVAGMLEVGGVIGISEINRAPRFRSWLILVGGFLSSFLFLSLAMEAIAMSIAYAVWTGIGTVGSTVAGIFLFREAADWKRLAFIALIIVSVIGLRISG